MSEALGRLARAGVGILLTDHNVKHTLERCDTVYILEGGNPCQRDPP